MLDRGHPFRFAMLSADILSHLSSAVGAANVLAGRDAEGYGRDWTGKYTSVPGVVVRPGSAAEVASVVRIASETGTPVVPAGGRTGLTGATEATGRIMLSLERMNRIREIRPEARIAIAEAGVVLSSLHDAAADHGLAFPLTFGARGSAMIGGCLSTNAGGSNVLRYGSTRGLCLGIEAVMADGRVLNLMSELHKDNSGYDLKDLLIGAEGTLGIVTAAVLRLVPRPVAYASAMVALETLGEALDLLNRLQSETAGGVEAFEYMPASYVARHLEYHSAARPPFDGEWPVNIFVEIASTAPRDAEPGQDGQTPLAARLEGVLAEFIERGIAKDAVVASSEGQRREMWARREAAAEIMLSIHPLVDCDIAVPLDRVQTFLDRMEARLKEFDPGARWIVVAHLGDGNIHYNAYPTRDDPALLDAIRDAVDREAVALGGSFSAEHGIGLSKRASMAALKDPVALDVMRRIKAALDPNGILNPGKVLP